MPNVSFLHAARDHQATQAPKGMRHILGMIASVGRHYRNRRELNTLLGLSDSELRDVGIARSDIQRESIKPLWRD
jgi:uncharacterized protein YjiS (DUF1127 family)